MSIIRDSWIDDTLRRADGEVLAIDGTWRAARADPGVAERLGLTGELVGCDLRTVLPPALLATWAHVLALGRPSTVRLPAGGFVDLLPSAGRLVVRFRSTDPAAAELCRSNAELDAFTGVVAHELVDPLAALELGAELLEGDLERGSDAANTASRLRAGLRRARETVAALRAYARTDAGPLDLQPVDLHAVLADVRSDLGALLASRGATVREGPLATVRADEVLLRQLLRNLVANAVKFSPPSPPDVVVEAKRDDRADGWTVTVADRGPGIAPDALARAFDMFERLDAADEVPGSGVGLTICRRIAERHGGRLEAESRPGEGSTFRLVLPDLVA